MGSVGNAAVLRSRFTDHLNFRSLLQQVRERVQGVNAHLNFSFEQLVAELAPERDPSHAPLFQVMFVLNNPEKVAPVAKTSASRPPKAVISKYDLTLFISETDNVLEGSIEYCTDLFEAHTIQRLCGHYRTLLEAIVRDPDQRISTLDILTDRERTRILYEWNDCRTEYWSRS